MFFPAFTPPAACYSVSSRPCPKDAGQVLPQNVDRPALLIPAAMEMKGAGWQNAIIGPVLQCLEAATLGMPFEVLVILKPARKTPQKASLSFRCTL
jgi:hypothetical protein